MATLVTFESQDIDSHAESVTHWEQSYEQLGCGRFRGSVWQLLMRDGELLRETGNRRHRQQLVPPKGHLVLAMPLAVDLGSVFDGQQMGRDSLIVINSRTQHDMLCAGEIELIALAVDSSLIETMLAPDTFEWLERKTQEHNVALPPETACAMRHLLMAMCDNGERLDSEKQERELIISTVSHAVNLAMEAEQEISPTTIPRRSKTRLKVVSRAVEFMQASLHEDIGVSEICAAACASRRTLHYCFEEFLHSTPQEYLRALRLNEARRTLKVRADLSITELACVLGFSNASHFTRHYKRMFDEMPSHTRSLQSLSLLTNLKRRVGFSANARANTLV